MRRRVVITGIGAQLTAPLAIKQTTLADANASLAFGNLPNPAGSLVGIAGGTNLYQITPTVQRTLTISQSGASSGTRVTIKNNGTVPVIIAPNAISIQGPTYIAPGGEWRAFSLGSAWIASPQVQCGVTTLVNGVSPVITADITATSRIVATLKNVSGVFGTIAANARTNGTKAGGGSFQLSSLLSSTGAVVVTDQGDYDWHICGS